MQIFAQGSWGGEWHPDFAPQAGDLIATEHWGSSGFANTNLDTLLKQRAITRVILVGLIANTCLETTGKYAVELGYHVTLVRDATAAASVDAMRCAHDINGPTYAHAILTTAELLGCFSRCINAVFRSGEDFLEEVRHRIPSSAGWWRAGSPKSFPG